MKKMQCEVCGSTEIRKIADDIFECQSCGIQYSTAEVKKLLVEVTGTVKIDHSDEVENSIKRAQQFEQAGNNKKAEEYYNAALDMDADNQLAQQKIRKISGQNAFSEYFVVEPEISPEENVRLFLEQLASTKNIACDIYKELAIKSVTEKYLTFFFIKTKYRYDWSAIICNRYYEKQTVYKNVYNSNLKRYVKEPVTEKVERIQRTPQHGSKTISSSELVLASDSLSKLFPAETQEIKNKLLSAFEKQQDNKYETYKTSKINTAKIENNKNKTFYNGIEFDTTIDNRIYVEKKKKMASDSSDRAAEQIQNSLGGDFYENLTGNVVTLSETTAYICIPVQIIEYTYKGKTYTALSDLISHITTKPAVYPCDTELQKAVDQLDTQKEKLKSAVGLAIGLILVGLGFLPIIVGAILNDYEDFLVPVSIVLMLIALIVIFGSLINEKIRNNKFNSNAETVKDTLFNPRVEAIEKTKEQFFKEYSDYNSAKKAASNTECISISNISPEVSESGPIRKKMAFSTTTVESDDTITTLEKGINQVKEKRKKGILAILLSSAAIGGIAILLATINDITSYFYLITHSVAAGILWTIVILSATTFVFGTLAFGLVMNTKISQLKFAIEVYKQRKQFREEFSNSEDQPKITVQMADYWTDERIRDKVSEIAEHSTEDNRPLKEKVLDSIKAHKIPAIITGCIVFLLIAAVTTEMIICRTTAKPYENALINKTYAATDKYETSSFFFMKNGKYERASIRTGNTSNEFDSPVYEYGTYSVHYDFVTKEYTLILGTTDHEVKCGYDSNIRSFKAFGDTYYEVIENEKASDINYETENTNTNADSKQTTAQNHVLINTNTIETTIKNSSEDVVVTESPLNTVDKEVSTQQTYECPHLFVDADCITPKTCIFCNETVGSPLGHDYTELTCTSSKICLRCNLVAESAPGHRWIYEETVTEYAEEGHFEEEYTPVTMQRYRCFPCAYYQPTYATLEEYYAHFDSTHADDPNSAFLRKNYEIIQERSYEIETVWIVDQEACTETIIVSQTCKTCGIKENY